MDGTLVDSTAGVVGAWEEFAKAYPNIQDKMHDILSSCVIGGHLAFAKD